MVKIKEYSKCLLLSFMIAIIFLSVSACIFAYTSIQDRHLQSFVFGVVMISVLIGSMMLCRKMKEKGLLYGALFGILYLAIIYLFTVIAFQGFFVSNTLGIYAAISILSGVVGGIIGVNV